MHLILYKKNNFQLHLSGTDIDWNLVHGDPLSRAPLLVEATFPV